MNKNLRNIAIIAHVDHGKTTLVDELLKQSGTFDAREETETRMMDSNDLEKERGITILAKNTALVYGDMRINIVDTPGHSDFGGEVERILNMVDGVLLLVDAREGPMPQTKFVTSKALALGLKPIVVINKIDREGSDPDAVVDATFDLFASLGATDEQLDFPVVYASAKNGYAKLDLAEESDNLTCLFDTIIKHVNEPEGDANEPLQMLATTLAWDDFIGRIVIGRIAHGTIKTGLEITVVHADSSKENFRITKLLGFKGLQRIEIDHAEAGDIVAVAGIETINIGETIADKLNPVALPIIHVDEPTLTMELHVNSSPLAGTEGKFITTRQIRDRLMKEVRTNVAMRVRETDAADVYEISGRGELHIGILLENMRREGFEMAVSRPSVIVREIDGVKQEPYEHVTVDVESDYQGTVIEKLGLRGAEMTHMQTNSDGSTRIEFMCPTRGLIGYTSEFLTDTRGTGVMHHLFHAYGPYIGKLPGRKNGVLIANGGGESVAFALWNLQERGKLFIGANTKLYEGMIIGIHSRDNDLVVNATKAKKLTNTRASGKDDAIDLVTPLQLTLERAIEFIDDDELVEVTPKSIRLRKRKLLEHERKRSSKD
ncbi:MAG: translational GTPase TypA [Zetaproteobacteria bacterium CG06_land_8_20_14_3_00_59_53]|nr:MAG: GTP-binding protein TypA [Zetaproteobacteria bacterium CG2_30_59_37]PIU71371.1 MAG: translational GTPase TypA [Zetaproteobacteria bacterium CG06_land_8_20_14_3_00_59_53]HCS13134.1 translational GTPase TypA [Zetaproteobacteria bacterium]